jgi:hypothetical protein
MNRIMDVVLYKVMRSSEDLLLKECILGYSTTIIVKVKE